MTETLTKKRVRLTQEDKKEVAIAYLVNKEKQTDIANRYGISQATVSYLVKQHNKVSLPDA